MLEPQDRLLLLDSLRPPDGYQVDRAIGTTYSLDLVALLTTPLAFTFFEWQNDRGRPDADPLLVLEAIRRYAERITIFCQAGQIKIPTPDQKLIPYLEKSVIEVQPAEARGVFHPKVWILRFTASGSPIRYRFLCLSRNLTFDRSWDTVLTLDGVLQNRQNAYSRNHPLGDFVAALPELAIRPPVDPVRQQIREISEELRRVEFEIPVGYENVTFRPLGITNHKRRWPFDGDIRRMLVVSPFVSAECLQRLSAKGEDHLLISRVESLQPLSKTLLSRFAGVYSLSDGAHDIVEDEDSDSGIAPSTDNGLHAKIYVADAGWRARVWIGSANATNSAFGKNVEFLVELEGKKGVCGVDAILHPNEGTTGLGNLLQTFEPAPDSPPEDAVLKELEKCLRDAVRSVCTVGLTARVVQAGAGLYDVRLAPPSEAAPLPIDSVTIQVWPTTLSEARAVTMQPEAGWSIPFQGLSFDALTSFYAFEVKVEDQGQRLASRFVLNLELLGAPPNRREQILRSLLRDPEQLLRLILLILRAGEEDLGTWIESITDPNKPNTSDRFAFAPARMFESLVRTLARRPEKLDEIAHLLEELRASPESADIVPPDFAAIWEPIWNARQKLKPGAPHETA
jgi:hypothetical protein